MGVNKMPKKRLSRNMNMLKSNTTLKNGFDSFIKECEVKNLAEDTVKTYQRGWKNFKEFLTAEFEEVQHTSEITKEMPIEFILYTRNISPNISDATINNRLRSIRAVLYYFMDNNLTENFPIKQIKEILKGKQLYTEEEQIKLLKQPDKKASFTEYRNWVIMIHFFSTGNRSRTVREIKIKNVYLNRKIILLESTKNNEPYEIPICNFYYPILKEYLQERFAQGADNENYLFCTQYGQKFTADGFRTSLNKYNISRGVDKTSLHLIRHTFATTWIIEGGSREKLQTALGQKSSAMVDKYVHMSGKDLINEFESFTPIGKIKDEIGGKNKLSRSKYR